MKKQVKYVYLYCLTTGNQTPVVKFYKDRSWQQGDESGPGTLMQRADHNFQPVYEPTDDDLEDSIAVWGTSFWQDKLLTEIRYPVTLGSLSSFAIEIEAVEAMIFMGYSVELNVKGQETIRGRAVR